nr:aminotransferase class III-fold pyridoxal phosphate-dependent enzyme [Bradyrhizobium pachyrhizi]
MTTVSNRNAGATKSSRAFARERGVVPGGSMRNATWFAPHPPYAAKGIGCFVEDLDGRQLLDCANNFFSLIHGHAFAPVVEAIRAAAGDGTAFGLPTEKEIALAELIRGRSPRCEQVRFCTSGTEAVMFAIKGARALTGRRALAKFEGAYHGSYDWVEVSLAPEPAAWDDESGNPASIGGSKGVPKHVLQDTVVLPWNDPDRCAAILDKQGSRLAALIIDPVPSRAGMVPVSKKTVEVIHAASEKHGFLIISDEVISFRLSYAGAHPLFGLQPDLITLGKIIGGGLPIGAVAGSARTMSVFDHTQGKPGVALGGTFSANPLAMAAGFSAMTALDEAAIARLNQLGSDLRSEINLSFIEKRIPAQVTGSGSLFRLHLTAKPIADYRSSRCGTPDALRQVHAAALEQGVLLTPNCSGAISTPMEQAHIDDLSTAITRAVADTFAVRGWDQ